MMRRVSMPTLALAGARAKSEFGFGHPEMTKEFSPSIVGTAKAAPTGTQVTQMPNGARIISEDRAGAQSSIGFYVRAGPKFDPSNRPGMSNVMRFALMNSNMDKSKFQVDRDMRATGISQSESEVRKEWLGFKGEGRRDLWQSHFENIATCIAVPRFAEWDTERFRDTMDALSEEKRWCLPREYCADQLESVAYYKQPIGSPRMVPKWANDLCNHSALVEHWASFFVPKNVVVAGVNVDHDALVAAYTNAPYAHSADAPHHRDANKVMLPTTNESAQYSANEWSHVENRQAVKGGTHEGIDNCVASAIGFNISAGRKDAASFANSLVLKELISMSLGDAAATGDAQFEGHVRGLQSFNRTFDTASLIGITTQSAPADGAADIKEAHKVLKTGVSITADTLKVAQTKAATRFYHDEIEYQRDYLDFLGTSLIGDSTKMITSEEILKAISGTSAQSVKAIYDQGIVNGKASMYTTGPVTDIPSMKQMGF